MGLRGPKKTPTKLLEIRGSWRAKTRHDPIVGATVPAAPAYLNKAEKRLFKAVSGRLSTVGLISQLDGEILGRYCTLLSQWTEAKTFLDTHGQSSVVIDLEGNQSYRLYPQVKLIVTLHESLARIESHFGMSPSARASLGTTPQRTDHAQEDRFFKTS